jgi:hypothetical protein
MNRIEIIARATARMVADPVEYGIEAYRHKGQPRYAIVYRVGNTAWKRTSSWASRAEAYGDLVAGLKGAQRV